MTCSNTLEWKNNTGIDIDNNPEDYLGFIYEIELNTGEFYVGRRQFWYKRGRGWKYCDYGDYYSSSDYVKEHRDSITGRTILGVFSSKSALRYAEALAIIVSGAYCCTDKGLNRAFDGCKSAVKLTDTDRKQLELIREYYEKSW